MIEEFGDIKINQEFVYLEEKWIKISNIKASRIHDGYIWIFKKDESVEVEDINDNEF